METIGRPLYVSGRRVAGRQQQDVSWSEPRQCERYCALYAMAEAGAPVT